MRAGGATSPTTPASCLFSSSSRRRARWPCAVPHPGYSPMRGGQTPVPSAGSQSRSGMVDQAPKGDVLIVEDDPALREVYGEVLTGEGYGVRLAANGFEALALLDA